MESLQDGVSLNVVIIPPDEILNQAIMLSQQVTETVETEFVLNTTNIFPHITLYQAQYPTKNIPLLKENLHELVAYLQPFTIDMQDFSLFYETFVFWNCIKTEKLFNLQEQVISKLNPMRKGLILPHLVDVTNISEEDKKDIANYGSLLIGERYNPHITITRLKQATDADKTIEKLSQNKKPFSFQFSKITLGYLGTHGTFTEIIEEFIIT